MQAAAAELTSLMTVDEATAVADRLIAKALRVERQRIAEALEGAEVFYVDRERDEGEWAVPTKVWEHIVSGRPNCAECGEAVRFEMNEEPAGGGFWRCKSGHVATPRVIE